MCDLSDLSLVAAQCPVRLVGRTEVGADQIRMELPSLRIQTNILTRTEIKKCFKQSRFCPVKFRALANKSPGHEGNISIQTPSVSILACLAGLSRLLQLCI